MILLGFAGIDDALWEGEVGSHEEVIGSAVDDLRGQRRGGLVRGKHVDAGLGLEIGKGRWEDWLKIRGRGEAEVLLCECRGSAEEQKSEGEAKACTG
jgi:hypothetical protein